MVPNWCCLCLHALPLTAGQHMQDTFVVRSSCLTWPAGGLEAVVFSGTQDQHM